MLITKDDYFKKDLPVYKRILLDAILKYEHYEHFKDAPDPTLNELYNLYVQTYPRKEYYLKWSFKALSPELKEKKFKEISLLEWQTQINKLIEKQQALSTQKHMRGFVKQLQEFAIKIDMDISPFFSKLKVERPKEPNYKIPYTLWEIQQLWKNLHNNPDIKDILILIYTGLRISEYLNLKIEDIHFDKRYFIVTKSKTKTGTNRLVPIHKDIARLLKEKIILAQKYHSNYIAISETSKEHYNYGRFSTMYKRCFRYMSFNHTIHECRHTFITLLDQNEVPIIVIKKIVGHAPDDLTGKVYTHVSFHDIISAVDKLKGHRLLKEKLSQEHYII
jgi:integrase